MSDAFSTVHSDDVNSRIGPMTNLMKCIGSVCVGSLVAATTVIVIHYFAPPVTDPVAALPEWDMSGRCYFERAVTV